MARAERVFRNLYRDSVSLMQLSAKLGVLPGVRVNRAYELGVAEPFLRMILHLRQPGRVDDEAIAARD